MSKYQLTSFSIVLLNLGTLVSSLAYDYSYNPPPPLPSPNYPPPPHSPSPKPPPPPIVNPTPPPSVVKPPPPPPPSEVKPTPPPPVVKPPPPPPPPQVKPTPPPPTVKPPPPPPPPNVGYPPPPKQQTCPINALRLGACVHALGDLIHIGIAKGIKKKCCPLLYGLADLDAAICLCTAIRIKAPHLIDILVPFSLHVLVNDCGKHPPAGFQCPTN